MSKRLTKAEKLRAAKQAAGELAFQKFWNGEAMSGAEVEIVRNTLAFWCGWNKSPYHKDPREQEANIGAHKIFLQLQAAAGVASPFSRQAGSHYEEPEDRSREHRVTGENDG